MKTKMITTFALLGIIVLTLVAQKNTIDYFGQTLPGDSAVVFAPGIISLADRLEGNIVFSIDGNECYFTVYGANYSTYKIYYSKRVNNVWTPQVEAPFSVGYKSANPYFSIDGNKLYFDRIESKTLRVIWVLQRTSQGWSNPQLLSSPVNSNSWNFSYSESADTISYFSSNRLDGHGVSIWRTRRMPDQSLQVENLGAIVNSSTYDFGPCIAPDGSYIIFVSYRPGGYGDSDLYVTFSLKNGGWTTPVNLGPSINTIAGECGATLSPDGRYLFFSRYSKSGTESSDIYWVSTKIIDDIKKEVFNPKISK